MKTDADHISNGTLLDIDGFAEEAVGFWPYIYRMKKTENGKCIFLKEDLCSIYELRPLICKFYPFQLNFRNRKYSFSHTNDCPGIGKGPQLKKTFFENLFSKFLDAME